VWAARHQSIQLASIAKGKELEGLELALRLYNEPECMRRYMPRR